MSICSTYSAERQSVFCQDRMRCMVGTAPTIEAVTVGFGKECSVTWIGIQLTELSEYCGVRSKITPYQLHSLSAMIADEFSHLKVTEFMLFAHDFKMARIRDRRGDVVGFYGSAAPDVLAKALHEWERMRKNEVQIYLMKSPGVSEAVDRYREQIKNAVWQRLYILNHSHDEAERRRVLDEFRDRGIDMDDYWKWIDDRTEEYRQRCERLWNEKYRMPWR